MYFDDNVNDFERLRQKLAVVRDGCTGSILFCSAHLRAESKEVIQTNAAVMAGDLRHLLDCGWIHSADADIQIDSAENLNARIRPCERSKRPMAVDTQ